LLQEGRAGWTATMTATAATRGKRQRQRITLARSGATWDMSGLKNGRSALAHTSDPIRLL